MENQFIAFDDSQIKEEAEIIYVLDDPRILPEFKLKINHLQRIYNIDCRYVFGQINRGFASSNNLGAKIACGQYLIFMNSDVFPLEKGWLGKIINQMEVDDRCGAVGVKLLYADGTIQHVGMNFLFNYEVNIWTNIHPNAGLSPELLEDKKSHKVPAVTGACVAVRREDFEKINGWCEDYIIGDFEDSDFCFRIISLGKYIYVNTDIEMVHLERQSFILMGGEESFRQNLTILNGIIHQHKWHDLLIESLHQESKQ